MSFLNSIFSLILIKLNDNMEKLIGEKNDCVFGETNIQPVKSKSNTLPQIFTNSTSAALMALRLTLKRTDFTTPVKAPSSL